MALALDQLGDERRPGMPMVLLDAGNPAHEIGPDIAVHVSHVDIDDAHRHAGDPGCTVGADLLFERAFARQHRVGRPGVTLLQDRPGRKAGFALTAGNRVDKPRDGAAVGVGKLVEREHRSRRALREHLDGVFG